ncbi:MAG: glycosyltransferase family 4 protein [Thermoleophilaceae bacterium]
MRIQLWSYNYDPEPQGIAPLSTMLAKALRDRGHVVQVVAAHPHYPDPVWGRRLRPYRERRDGIEILRVPLWAGRDSGLERLRQELTFTMAQSLVTPLLPVADVLVATSPSLPALAPAMAMARARRMPWVMWLQDIVTDAAATTGLLGGRVLAAAQRFERATYASASRIVVISGAFRSDLLSKGVAEEKIVRILNPSTRDPTARNQVAASPEAPPRILAMGNIGHSQALDRIVDAFQLDSSLAELGARLVIAGTGVAAEEVRKRVGSGRVEMRGVLYGEELEPDLRAASLGLVSQRADVLEFNLPSKLMNYMAYGLPVIASVRLGSETARIVEESGAGWVTDARHPAQFASKAAELLQDPVSLDRASKAGFEYARAHFAPTSVAERFEAVLEEVAPATAAGWRSGSLS